MAVNVNTAFQTMALLAIALMPVASSTAAEPTGAVPNDPFVDAVFQCHSKYVEDYTSIANTASSIADRAAAQCRKQMDAYENHALALAQEEGVEPSEVEAKRDKLISLLKEGVRTFTLESAARFGATSD